MSRFSFVFTIAALVGAAACANVALHLDGGAGDDAGAAGLIEVESEPSLTLAFGEEAVIAVRYTEAGQPVANVEIRFALEGRAHDSTLGALSVVTDANGRARTTLLAGSTSAVFRVRASAERAGVQYVNVSIGNMGFGALRAGAIYDGGRQGGASRVVSVYTEIDCAPEGELPVFADRTSTLTDDAEEEVLFRALPAGLHYAVVGRLVGPDGTTLAIDCIDSVEIVRDDEVRVDLRFEDVSLVLEGEYDLELALAPAAETLALVDLASEAGEARIAMAGSGAALYLDALEAELRARGATSAADLLATERIEGTADASLALRLDEGAVGPSQALSLRLAQLRERMSEIELTGPLSMSVGEGVPIVATWDARSFSIGVPGDPDRPPLLFAPDDFGIEPAPELSLALREDADVLEISSIRLTLALGRLIEAIVLAEAAAAGVDEPAAMFLDGAGCDVFAGWISESPALTPSCDEDCAHKACLDALGQLLDAVQSALAAVDEIRNAIEITGEATLVDANGDLAVDTFTGIDLSGTWSGLEPVDPVSAELLGRRIPVPE